MDSGLLKLLTPGRDGRLVIDLYDEVQRSMTGVTRRREDVAATAGAGVRHPATASAAERTVVPAAAETKSSRRASATGLLVSARSRCSWWQPSRRTN